MFRSAAACSPKVRACRLTPLNFSWPLSRAAARIAWARPASEIAFAATPWDAAKSFTALSVSMYMPSCFSALVFPFRILSEIRLNASSVSSPNERATLRLSSISSGIRSASFPNATISSLERWSSPVVSIVPAAASSIAPLSSWPANPAFSARVRKPFSTCAAFSPSIARSIVTALIVEATTPIVAVTASKPAFITNSLPTTLSIFTPATSLSVPVWRSTSCTDFLMSDRSVTILTLISESAI